MDLVHSDAFPFPEDRLRVEIGFSRETMRAYRADFTRGEDWELEGRTIYWSPKGAEKLRERLEVPTLAKSPPDEQPEAQAEVLTVVSRPAANGQHCANRYIIKARRENGEMVGVRVPDASKFTPFAHGGAPMTLRAERGPYGWFLVGRGPRWTGRW